MQKLSTVSCSWLRADNSSKRSRAGLSQVL